jgi:hypothetical protein
MMAVTLVLKMNRPYAMTAACAAPLHRPITCYTARETTAVEAADECMLEDRKQRLDYSGVTCQAQTRQLLLVLLFYRMLLLLSLGAGFCWCYGQTKIGVLHLRLLLLLLLRCSCCC